MSTIETIFDEVADRLASEHADVERGRIFRSTGLKTGDRFFAFVRGDDIVMKLPAGRVEELISSGAGRVFDRGKGKPLKEWVQLRPPDAETFAGYAAEARTFVGGH